MLKYIILVCLAVVTGIHLYHSWLDIHKKRCMTKPLLLLLITAYYLVSVQSPNTVNIVLIVALLTSWLGDVLLMPRGMKWFVAGGVSFLISHLTFICVYYPNIVFANVKWYFVVPVACCYLAVIIWLFKMLIPHATNKPLFAALAMYICINATMNVFAFMQLLGNPCAGSILAYIGAVLFFCSDTSLFLLNFHPNKNLVFKKHFTIMLTYVLGEFLITQGVMMLQLS